jgi:hypothetical protein
MSKQNFIAGKGFSVEDDDGIVTSFLEVASGNNIELKNLTKVNQNHTFLGDLSQKNNYIMVARTNFSEAVQNFTLGDYTQTLGVYPELQNYSVNIIRSNIVAFNTDNLNYKFSLNYDWSVVCNDNEITEISDIQTVFVEEFPTSITWLVEPFYNNRNISFTATGNPGTPGQEIVWMCHMEIISSSFVG